MPMRAPRVVWIRRDRQHRLRCRLEQQIIDQRLIVERYAGDLCRQREHDVEVSHRQQVGFPMGEPCTCGRALAPGTVPVAAAVIGDPPLPAVLAGFDMAAKRRGAAVLNRRHDLELLQTELPCMGDPVGGPGSTEDVGDLDRGAHAQPSGEISPGLKRPSLSSGLVTERTVRIATLA